MSIKINKINGFECVYCRSDIDASMHLPFQLIQCPSCGKSTVVPGMFGKHVLLEKLGEGTTGKVFRAIDRELHRQVALKILEHDQDFTEKDGEEGTLMRRTLREARMLALINHENVVQVYALSSHKGQPYIEMEILDGGTVEELLAVKSLPNEGDVLDLALQVSQGLSAALKAGLIHYDIKPGNILYDHKGKPKLIDFGAAESEIHGAYSGFFGTPYYVAPEAAKRQFGNHADHRADMYSLGATMFHLLAGRPPFIADSVKDTVLLRFKNSAPRLNAFREDLSAGTVNLVARLLKSRVEDRFENYDDLIDSIYAVLDELRQKHKHAKVLALGKVVSEEAEDYSQHMSQLVLEAHHHQHERTREEDVAINALAGAFEHVQGDDHLVVGESTDLDELQLQKMKELSSNQSEKRWGSTRLQLVSAAVIALVVISMCVVIVKSTSKPRSKLDDPFLNKKVESENPTIGYPEE